MIVIMTAYTGRLDRALKPGDEVDVDEHTAKAWVRDGIAKIPKTKAVKPKPEPKQPKTKKAEVTENGADSRD